MFKKGREEEAIEVLCDVFDLPRDDPYIVSEVRAIKHAVSVEAGVRSHRALFKGDKLKTRRRIILAYFGLFMNQMVGINLVVYYAPSTFAVASNMPEANLTISPTCPKHQHGAADRTDRGRIVGGSLTSLCHLTTS